MDIKSFFKVGEVFGYYFRKKDPTAPSSTFLRMMHWSNRISVVVFLVCAAVIFYRLFIR
jgi:hypothetical protein